jgi:hypothetical protein
MCMFVSALFVRVTEMNSKQSSYLEHFVCAVSCLKQTSLKLPDTQVLLTSLVVVVNTAPLSLSLSSAAFSQMCHAPDVILP